MKEDVKITRRILEHFAQDNVGYPANVSFDDLCKIFSDIDHQTITYHLRCACDEDLLYAKYTETGTYSGILITFEWISGLTRKGSDYVRHSNSSLWSKAIDRLNENKIKITTSAIAELFPILIKEGIGG